MEIEILNSPANTVAKVSLAHGEKIISESGAMIAMSKGLDVTTSSKTRGGGVFKAVKRAFAGESFLLNTFEARSGPGEIYLAAELVGDMAIHQLKENCELIVQSGSFVACSDTISIDTTTQGLKSSLLSGESLFWLKMSGTGTIILSSFGGIYEREVKDGYIVDTGHIVAFESSLSFEVKKITKSIWSSLTSGEGFVCHFNGSGRLFCQTHHGNNFGHTLRPGLKPRD